jgi:hypothetical protein
VDEIKQVSGNRDVNNGSSASVTAASAIAALQEAGNGLSRDMTASGYRAFRKVVHLCIELIRQFYDLPRRFRILGPYGADRYVSYSNRNLRAPAGLRLPVFDIQVEVRKQSKYEQAAYNDLAISMYKLGVFDPARAEQSLMLLEMMDFKGKDALCRRIAQNGQAYRQQSALAVALEQSKDGETASGTKEHPFVAKARQTAQGGSQ